jgi:hypothetical protein
VASHSLQNPALREELLGMAEEDARVREELAAAGTLHDGYHPRMERVHRRNASRLHAILDQHGWPGRTMVGADGAHAAWIVVQHAIGDPALQRRALPLLRSAAAQGEVSVVEVAMLEDRIRVSEGRLQRYGTQYDWDADGRLSPLPVEDPEHVDERRRAVGLSPLEECTARQRERAAEAREKSPADWRARQQEMHAWFRASGWRA